MLTNAQADAALHAYIGRHRRAWDTMKPVLENILGSAITEQDTQLPMVELRLSA